ncbi:MAG: hypothetical protein ABFD08_10960 [Syntrophomonas sp.]
MNNYELIGQLLELSRTVGEGIEHINGRFNAGRYEDALVLLPDVVQAFVSIQQAIGTISIQLTPNKTDALMTVVNNSLNHVCTAYEQQKWGLANETIQYELFPAYLEWKAELERCFGSYVAS